MNVTDDLSKKAAKILVKARNSGPIENLPSDCRPKNIEEVYSIHDAVANDLGPIEGWKVGASDVNSVPICAPLLFGTIYKSPVYLDRKKFAMRGIESEIAFKFANDLPARGKPYSKNEVLESIETAYPAIEINETRYINADTVDHFTRLADNILNGALVLGPNWFDWSNLVVEKQAVELRFDGEIILSHKGGNKAVDILRLVVWIANHVQERDLEIKSGSIVTTGSWTGLKKAGATKKITTRFRDIGEVVVNF